MLNMELGYLVKNLVRGLHGDKNSAEASGSSLKVPDYFHEKPTKALLLSFDIRAHRYYPNGNEISSCRMLHLLFHRFRGSKGFCSTYTFGATTDIFQDIQKATSIEFLSSHDSCWDDAANSYISKVEYSMLEEMNKQDTRIDRKKIHWHISFPFSLDPFKWIDVEFYRMPRDPNNSFRDEIGVKLL